MHGVKEELKSIAPGSGKALVFQISFVGAVGAVEEQIEQA